MNPPPPPAENEPLKFHHPAKLLKQMRKRGWTEALIREALKATPEPWRGKLGPAWRYTHPESGQTLLVDAATGAIFHVGAQRYRYDG